MNTQVDNLGLSDQDVLLIRAIVMQYPSVTDVHVFGSRAMGTHKLGSDVDLALMGEQVSDEDVLNIKLALEDTNMPYMFDVVRFHGLEKEQLIAHIRRVGKSLV